VIPASRTTNPALPDSQLTLRRAFLASGLPRVLTLDHGIVFSDHRTPSPFPTKFHLWLLALGIQVRFTRKRCPTAHAIIERTYQTMTAQALLGQTSTSHADLRVNGGACGLASLADLSMNPPIFDYQRGDNWSMLTTLPVRLCEISRFMERYDFTRLNRTQHK
jgi:transposase InsO family protein